MSGLLGMAGALALDPERLLWRPGTKLISIPMVPTLRVVSRTEAIDFEVCCAALHALLNKLETIQPSMDALRGFAPMNLSCNIG